MKKYRVSFLSVLAAAIAVTGCGQPQSDVPAQAYSYSYSIQQMTSLDLPEGKLSDVYAYNSYCVYEPLTECPMEGLTYSYTYHPSSEADRSQWRYTYLDADGREYDFDVMGRLVGWSSLDTASLWNIGSAIKWSMKQNAKEILSDLQIVLPEPYKITYDMEAQGITISWCGTTETTPTIILEGEEGICRIRYTQSGRAIGVQVEYKDTCTLSQEDREAFEQLLQEQLGTEDYTAETVCYKENGDVHALFMVEIPQEDGSIGTECYVAAKAFVSNPD